MTTTPRIVMKFGGTSVGTPEAMERTARHIAVESRWPVVVVSALGGVTNLLIDAAERAQRGEAYQSVFDEVIERHQKIVDVHGLDQGPLVEELAHKLGRLLSGIEMLNELSPRTRDLLLSLGERMSVRLLASMLRKMGLAAKGWDSWELGLLTDARYNKACLLPESDPRIQEAFKQFVKPGEIAIVTGFIGRTIDGEVTTLGRGGGDLSAAIFGATIGVEEIQIWTDVPGFLRADPRVVGSTSIIPHMRFEEAAELAYFGAKVLHPRTIEPARRQGIPVRILGTFQIDPEHPEEIYKNGTLIGVDAPPEPLRAIAARHDVDSLHIQSSRMLEAPGFLSRVFTIFARHGISVDVIATSEVSISMTLDKHDQGMHEAIQEISAFAEVEHAEERSILCLVGEGLKTDTTLLARVFEILSQHELPLHVISQGASQINITLVTEPAFANIAMEVLHKEFFSGQDGATTFSGIFPQLSK
ncbi:MAG: hypothetical protein CL920_05120 [Deltaproteobacteria bacterium]|nr:hypothetical protein [Deltaproteobacteria bacterium]MBU48062.1 hypothetical protein [Deltaproteobacteria bacterium]|tara:strand:+ start:21345 stop:22763 length:1419 start_codon:yes stop_codon:yes gene_type:complete